MHGACCEVKQFAAVLKEVFPFERPRCFRSATSLCFRKSNWRVELLWGTKSTTSGFSEDQWVPKRKA